MWNQFSKFFCSCRKYNQSGFLQLLCNAFVNRCNLYSVTVDTVQVANTMVKPYKVNKVNNVINDLIEAHSCVDRLKQEVNEQYFSFKIGEGFAGGFVLRAFANCLYFSVFI